LGIEAIQKTLFLHASPNKTIINLLMNWKPITQPNGGLGYLHNDKGLKVDLQKKHHCGWKTRYAKPLVVTYSSNDIILKVTDKFDIPAKKLE